MDSTTLDRLTQRLDRVERENRRLKRIGGVALIGLAAVALMGQAMPGKVAKVVEAERFIVRDLSGGARANLGLDPEGTIRLVLLDKRGTPVLTLAGMSSGSSALALGSKDGVLLYADPVARPGSG